MISTEPEQIFRMLAQLAREKTPFFADIWARQEKEFGLDWVKELATGVALMLGADNEQGWEDMLFGYADFSMDAIRQQNQFEESRRYQTSSAAETLDKYYSDETFMKNSYLPGLYLSHYLWRHHYRLLQFFRREVLVSAGSPRFFYEVGVGTGLYSCETLKAIPGIRGKGIDISQYSLDFAQQLLKAHHLGDRYEVECVDIFKAKTLTNTADFLICQEVLEHLEDPAGLCRMLRSVVKPGAKAYITAAINAANADHIYLFRSPGEVEKMLREAGWNIISLSAEYAYEGKPLDVTPCVAGYLCQKKNG